MTTTTYQTIEKPSYAEYKSKGSRFLSFAYPIKHLEDIKPYLICLQKEHHKAVHFCYAYRLGIDGLEFRANDDGEPSGSAGRPILGQIDSFELTDILIIVVRYFGGTLLGVPGLIQSYKAASLESLKNAVIIQRNVEKKLNLVFDYPQMSDVMHFIKQNNAQVIKQDLAMQCDLTVIVPLLSYQQFYDVIETMRTVKITKF